MSDEGKPMSMKRIRAAREELVKRACSLIAASASAALIRAKFKLSGRSIQNSPRMSKGLWSRGYPQNWGDERSPDQTNGENVMSDKENLWVQYDEAIEPAIDALQNFARLHREFIDDVLSIEHERFFASWVAQVLWGAGIDLERGVQSLADDGLPLLDGLDVPLPHPPTRSASKDGRSNGGEKP
jgi:hypothetical protein